MQEQNIFLSVLLTGIISAFLMGIAFYIIHRNSVNEWAAKLQKQLDLTNEAERKIHLNEMEYLSDRNKNAIAHADALAETRSIYFEEGRKQGKVEQDIETTTRLADQRAEFTVRLQAEKEQAATEARDKQRAEQELQAKLFSVKISPYVQLLTDNRIFKNTHEGRVGYQYQLLINGIPAFQPHVVIERHEKIEQVDQAIKNTLLSIAQNCAEAAVSTYLGASPKFAKLSPPVFEQLEK
jgi:hypothetical protein